MSFVYEEVILSLPPMLKLKIEKCQSKKLHSIPTNDDAINEGYDSKGGLLYYPEDLLSKEIDEDYNESPVDKNNDGNNNKSHWVP